MALMRTSHCLYSNSMSPPPLLHPSRHDPGNMQAAVQVPMCSCNRSSGAGAFQAMMILGG